MKLMTEMIKMQESKFVQTKVSKALYRKLRIQAAKKVDGILSRALRQAIEQYTEDINAEDEL